MLIVIAQKCSFRASHVRLLFNLCHLLRNLFNWFNRVKSIIYENRQLTLSDRSCFVLKHADSVILESSELQGFSELTHELSTELMLTQEHSTFELSHVLWLCEHCFILWHMTWQDCSKSVVCIFRALCVWLKIYTHTNLNTSSQLL